MVYQLMKYSCPFSGVGVYNVSFEDINDKESIHNSLGNSILIGERFWTMG